MEEIAKRRDIKSQGPLYCHNTVINHYMYDHRYICTSSGLACCITVVITWIRVALKSPYLFLPGAFGRGGPGRGGGRGGPGGGGGGPGGQGFKGSGGKGRGTK